jgi:ABC-type sugar transport system substrate-binding protein
VAEPTIVVALTSDGDEYQRGQAAQAEAVATRHGIELCVISGGGYAIEQIQQLFRFIHAPAGQRPAALVVEAVSEDGMARVARNAARAGIGWVSLGAGSWLGALRAELPGHPLARISGDQLEVGRLQGQQARALLPRGGRALCLLGPAHHAAPAERRRGMEEALRDSGIDVTFAEGQWTAQSGARLLRSWTRLRLDDDPGFDLLIAQNDDMAAGARAVLVDQSGTRLGRRSWAELPILGVDGLDAVGKAMVDQGELAGTVVNPLTTGAAVELLAAWLDYGEPVTPEVVLRPRSYPELSILQSSDRRPVQTRAMSRSA